MKLNPRNPGTKEYSPLFLITFAILLFAVVMNFSAVLGVVRNVLELFSPILIGLLMAFVLNVPMTGMEHILNKIFNKIIFAKSRIKRRPSESLILKLSLILTLICIVLIITLACTLLIPTLTDSLRSLMPLVRQKLPEWAVILKQYGFDTSLMTDWTEWLTEFDTASIPADLSGWFSSAIDATKNAVSSVTSVITNIAFGIVIAVYVLLSKKTLAVQSRKLAGAYLKPSTAGRLFDVAGLIRETYAKFLSGQCLEAVILGGLIALGFGIFGIPYATLTGFLTALFAFVPYVGAFVSFFLGAVLTLLVEPSKILPCIIVYPVIQFIENQFIYPQVVGSSVGLAPLWTLIAALMGGKLFGLAGIVFFIPLAAVMYSLLKSDVSHRLAKLEPPENPEKSKKKPSGA